ncbi:LysR family transcriptional regulator [Alloacidobacterium dinghuense]|uniref:LysR family transcriptional regulator n=1 Tax=Alloacidobacterium dinghuense TaxID=2763107 RepID=A0A7G8BC54_9BACT|nr:LysR family transcriptional regulator [Alloacidobacterium dinghuense]QNI30124.1 LysR family transcriptional regulator [Alloacidobacterium dinghuense]
MEFSSRQLRAFHLVARYRSFARAAEELLITASGLSVLIRELERQLGFRLFDRTTRQVTLTTFGNELIMVTEPGLGVLDAAMSRIEDSAKGRERWISVGTTPWLAANVLPPAIKQFRERRPDLRIRLLDGWLDEIQQRVQAGKLDMGVGIFKISSGVRRSPLFRFALMAVLPDQGAAINSVAMRWSSLRGQRLISLTKDYPHQLVIDKQLAKVGAVSKRGQVVKLLETQIALVEANEGIAVIPSFGMLACRNRKVTMSALIDPVVNLDFYQISNRGSHLSADAKEFSRFLETYIANWAGSSSVQ